MHHTLPERRIHTVFNGTAHCVSPTAPSSGDGGKLRASCGEGCRRELVRQAVRRRELVRQAVCCRELVRQAVCRRELVRLVTLRGRRQRPRLWLVAR